jgi:hypothetical protein
MNRFIKGAVLSCLTLAATLSSQAPAATFDFSYTFSETPNGYTPNPEYNGAVISGSFDGTLNGNTVTNITNISASFNGVSLNTPLYAYSYTAPGSACGTCYVAGGATVSFDPSKNNFLFESADSSKYFYVIPWPNGSQTEATQLYNANFANQKYVDYYNGQYVAANWSLSEVSAVPLPGALPMFGAALVGVVGWTRRRRQATV